MVYCLKKEEWGARELIRVFQKGFNYSQDGPGNRLVWHLQGCNLRCPWCSNPEGLELSGGREYTVEELAAEARDSSLMFFDGGGVTLTGGEVTLQLSRVKELLTRLHEDGINTCVETNGISPALPELFPALDLLIMDVKHYDREKHRAVTGSGNEATWKNASAALEAGQPLLLRIPLIGGFNASLEDAARFADLFRQIGVPGRARVELLRYHEYGRDKYKKLGLAYTMDETAKVPLSVLERYEEILRASGIEVVRT